MSQPDQQARPSHCGAGDQIQQAQGQSVVDRPELEMGDDPPSQYLADHGVSTKPVVVAGAGQCESPDLDGPADEIVSVVQLCRLMIELSSRVKDLPVEVLLDSGATSNVISDAMATTLKLKITSDVYFQYMTMAKWVTSMDCKVCPIHDELWGVQRKNHHQGDLQFVKGVYPRNTLVGA